MLVSPAQGISVPCLGLGSEHLITRSKYLLVSVTPCLEQMTQRTSAAQCAESASAASDGASGGGGGGGRRQHAAAACAALRSKEEREEEKKEKRRRERSLSTTTSCAHALTLYSVLLLVTPCPYYLHTMCSTLHSIHVYAQHYY